MKKQIIPIESIQQKIYYIRGEKVMLDRDLAVLYGVELRTLNQAVKRNKKRFPNDFMFQLNKKEYEILKFHFGTSSYSGDFLRFQNGTLDRSLKSQIVTSRSSDKSLRSQFVILEKGPGRGKYPKYLPYAFTEQGVAMLSSVLNSERAIQVNIQIMRTFTKLRKLLATHKELKEKIERMEKKYDKQFRVVFEAIKMLIKEDEKPKKKIGFKC